MDGINQNTLAGLTFECLIETLNTYIQNMKKARLYIHDDNDFDFVIDYIYYSPAQDEIIFRCTNKEDK
jgi:hypothetical protein